MTSKLHEHDSQSRALSMRHLRRQNGTRFVLAGFLILVIGMGIGAFASVAAQGFLSGSANKSAVASLIIEGETTLITADDISATQFDSTDESDSTPSADSILDYARNQVLLREAERRGIEAEEADVDEYAVTFLGTDDYPTIASQYGISEQKAKEILRQNAVLQKLYEEVLGPSSNQPAPEAPEAPEDNDYSTPKQGYADYIIDLAGDEWDTTLGTWSRTDGPYYAALQDEDFSAKSATYDQAMVAYSVAYQQYAGSDGSNEWISFINDLYRNAKLEIYDLAV